MRSGARLIQVPKRRPVDVQELLRIKFHQQQSELSTQTLFPTLNVHA